jgi:hypothetical protein
VRRNEPTRHQHPRPEPSYGSVPSNNREGYNPPSNSGYIPERGFSSPSHGDHSSYSGSGGSYNSAVGFSVKHVMELKKDGQTNPY